MKRILHTLLAFVMCAITLCAYGVKGSLNSPPPLPDGCSLEDGHWQFIPGKPPYGVEWGDWIWINKEHNGFKVLIKYDVIFESYSDNHRSEIYIKKIKTENEEISPEGVTLAGTMSAERKLTEESHPHTHAKKVISRTSTSVTYMEYCDSLVYKSCTGDVFLRATTKEDLDILVDQQVKFIQEHLARNRTICGYVHKVWTEDSGTAVCLKCYGPLTFCSSCGKKYCPVCDNHVCGIESHECYNVTCNKCGLTYCPICQWHDIDNCEDQEADDKNEPECDCPCHAASKAGMLGDGDDVFLVCNSCGHRKYEHK